MTKKIIIYFFLVTTSLFMTLVVSAKTLAQGSIQAVPSNTGLVKVIFDETGTIR